MLVDFSQLQCYVNCPRLYQNKYVNCLQRRKQDEGMQSRSFGSDVHGALNQYFLTHSPATAIEWFKAHYESIPNEKVRTKEHGLILLERFFPWWQVNFKHATVLGSEVQDSFKIGEIEYVVKIDLPVKVNDNVFAVDFKTTTNKTHYYYRQFSPNMQVSGYCYYLMLKYGSCAGFMPVVFHMGHRQNKYKGEPAGFWVKFDYDIVNRNKEQLNDFRYNVRMWVNKLQMSLDTGVFEKNEGFCESYYGCAFRDACIALDEPQIIENMYEVVNPREYLNVGL